MGKSFISIPALRTCSTPHHTSLANSATYSHPSITISRARHDESTSNLACHVWNCAPTDSTQTHALAVYTSGSKYTKVSHQMKIALWVTNCHRPFSIVEDTELLEIFANLNLNCETPSHHTVPHDVKEIFSLSHKEVGTMLQVSVVLRYSFNYLTISCRNMQGCFMLPLMDGLCQTLLLSLEPLSIGSLMARLHQLFLTSSSEFVFIFIVSFLSIHQGKPRLTQVSTWLSILQNISMTMVLRTRYVN